jgi:hypothetical protein
MLSCASTTELRQQRAAAGPCPDRCTSDGKAQVRHGAVGMRSHGLAGILGLAVTLIVSAAGCTASPPRPPAANSPTQGTAIGSSPAACTRTEITAAVARFFGRWNQHDTAAFGQLFDANGVLDMATKHQDTLAGHGAWVSSGGQDAIKGVRGAPVDTRRETVLPRHLGDHRRRQRGRWRLRRSRPGNLHRRHEAAHDRGQIRLRLRQPRLRPRSYRLGQGRASP